VNGAAARPLVGMGAWAWAWAFRGCSDRGLMPNDQLDSALQPQLARVSVSVTVTGTWAPHLLAAEQRDVASTAERPGQSRLWPMHHGPFWG